MHCVQNLPIVVPPPFFLCGRKIAFIEFFDLSRVKPIDMHKFKMEVNWPAVCRNGSHFTGVHGENLPIRFHAIFLVLSGLRKNDLTD